MAIKKEESNKSKSTNAESTHRLEPTIDSYIVNTIKLNKILRNQVSFDKIEFFTRSSRKAKSTVKSKKSPLKESNLSNKEVRECLKNFIVIMSLHCGLNSKLLLFYSKSAASNGGILTVLYRM